MFSSNLIIFWFILFGSIYSFCKALPILECFGQSCYVRTLNDPDLMTKAEAKQFNKHYPFRHDSFIAETYPNRVGDLLKAKQHKIEHALASIGLPTDKHDMNHWTKGKKMNKKKIRIKQQEWYAIQPGQKRTKS